MLPMPCRALALLIALVALPCSHAAGLPEAVKRALREAGLPLEAIAVMAAPTGPFGAPLLHQADKPMQPGSTMKLVTSVVALDRLGPNHRGRTELLATGVAQRGVLGGELVLRGGADPELGLPQLWALFAELRWKGVHTIEGDIVLDRSLFRPARLDIGLPPFDESPEFAYNMIPDALTVNGGLMGLQLGADDVLVSARVWPPLEGVEIINRLALNERECRDWDEDWHTPTVGPGSQPGRLALTLTGSFPRRCSREPQLALLERNQQIERQLRLVWQGLGGSWTGQVRDGVAPAEVRLVARRESRPWGELLRPLNKQSDNVLTRLLYLSLGVPAMAAQPELPTLALAERAVRDWFREQRIDDTDRKSVV
jgi:D-alanyl-D-alanine carboxypeptidase/D-alanyl-D-alanine-endopeptidase (penicillin-binding protein 4)